VEKFNKGEKKEVLEEDELRVGGHTGRVRYHRKASACTFRRRRMAGTMQEDDDEDEEEDAVVPPLTGAAAACIAAWSATRPAATWPNTDEAAKQHQHLGSARGRAAFRGRRDDVRR
jgi:hypothetical protein